MVDGQGEAQETEFIASKKTKRSGVKYFEEGVDRLNEPGDALTGTSNGFDVKVEQVMVPMLRAVAVHGVTGKRVEHLAADAHTLAWKLIGQQVNMTTLQWDKAS